MAGKGHAAPMMSKSEREYRDEDDHRTMMRASEIQNDHGRMAGVKRQQKKQEKALSSMRSMMGGHTMKGKR